jgi:hypothetical protein
VIIPEPLQGPGIRDHAAGWLAASLSSTVDNCFPPKYEKAHMNEVTVACALDVLQPAVVVG